MKILLINYYWQPWNNSGCFRWLNFAKYIDLDVLTSKKPGNSFYDSTIRNTAENVYRFGKIRAIFWGFLACFFTRKYDYYIITSPPESLLFTAWMLQLRGKKVLVDMRDSIDRNKQYVKFLVPLYRFFYKRIKNVIVSWKFIDPSKICIYHGYEEAKKTTFKGYYSDRVSHGVYLHRLNKGYIRDQSAKPEGYIISSFHTFKHLGFPVNFNYHPEGNTVTPQSIKTQANKIKKIINESIT